MMLCEQIGRVSTRAAAMLVLALTALIAMADGAAAHVGHAYPARGAVAVTTSAQAFPAMSVFENACRAEQAAMPGAEVRLRALLSDVLPLSQQDVQVAGSSCCSGAACHGMSIVNFHVDTALPFRRPRMSITDSRFVWPHVGFGLMRPPRT